MGEEIYTVADDAPGRMRRLKKKMLKRIKKMRKLRGGKLTELRKRGGMVHREIKDVGTTHDI